ncbi:MAG: hypothetical protein J6Y91_06515 [Alphaproteobacteria bacterium]|nr:hypothetical protein [Alphaproteobacteria bacterium]
MTEEEIKFRRDDVERAFIKKRNHAQTAQILKNAGISLQHPNYKDYYRTTLGYVHETHRFSIYNETAAQQKEIFDALSAKLAGGISVAEYQDELVSFRYQRAAFQFENSGGHGAEYSGYPNVKRIIDETIREGVMVRKDEQPYYPPEFYDEKGNLHGRIVMDIPWKIQSESAMYNIAMLVDKYTDIEFCDNAFIVKGQKVGPQRFFSSKKHLIERFFNKLKASPESLDMSDEALYNTLKNRDYAAFMKLNKERGISRHMRNADLRLVLKDEVLFGEITARLNKDIITREGLLSAIAYVAEDFKRDADIVKRESAKSTLGEINRVMFSIVPYDIATQATWRNWRTCMHANGMYHDYVFLNIGLGSIVAYGYNKDQPQKMISRVLIHAFKSMKGEVAYRANHRIYGKENLGFRKAVDMCVAHFNRGRTGIYDFHPELYSEDGVSVLNLNKNQARHIR